MKHYRKCSLNVFQTYFDISGGQHGEYSLRTKTMMKASKWVILPVYVSQNGFGQLELRTVFGLVQIQHPGQAKNFTNKNLNVNVVCNVIC